MISASERRTALYRFYDERENLLYVGITNDPWRRWRDHVQQKPWYPQVKHQATTWYGTEQEARRAEDRAIRTERPRFNIAGAVRPPEARPVFSPGDALRFCTTWVCIPGFAGCAMIAMFPAASVWPPADSLVQVLGWVVAVMTPTLLVPFAGAALVAYAPQAYRLGCWLDRNFGEEARRRDRAARPAVLAAREAARVPPSHWLIAPRRTVRVRRMMRTWHLPDYRQLLDWETERQRVAAVARRALRVLPWPLAAAPADPQARSES